MISIIIPLYNKEKQIRNTLETVFAQTFQEYEIVIINDGSTDQSVAIVETIKNEKIRLIHQENQGVSAARNKGIQEAKYDYVAFLDADDEWKPNYLSIQVDLIQSFPECRIFACAYKFRNCDEKERPIVLNKIPFCEEKGILSNYFEVASCSSPPLWTSAVAVEKKAILSVGGFPNGVKSGEDLLTWAKLAVKYEIAYSLKVLATFVEEECYEGKLENRIDKNDFVGETLVHLYQSQPEGNKKVQLSLYIARWYKILSVLHIEVADTVGSRKYLRKALSFGSSWKEILPYILISYLPSRIARLIWSQIRKIR